MAKDNQPLKRHKARGAAADLQFYVREKLNMLKQHARPDAQLKKYVHSNKPSQYWEA